MKFYDVIERRKTIRDFSDKRVNAKIIKRILEAGLKAPTHNHKREWEFLLLNSKENRIKLVEAEGISEKITPKSMKELFCSEDHLMIDMYLDAIPKQKRMLLEAPELLIVIYKPKTTVKESNINYDLNCLASIWCCVENILLAMTAEELYGVTYIPQKNNEIKKKFDIPVELEIAAIIPFGYKSDKAKILEQKNIRLDEKIHYENWRNK